MTTTASGSGTAAPMTGEEYLASLRDGRDVWAYGERITDVTTHPAFRNSARSIAHMYDALDDPDLRDVLTVPTDTGNGGFTHPFFRVQKSADDLVRSRDAIATWSRMTYGWLGRGPDYKASLTATMNQNADFYAPYQENARRFYREAQEKVLYLNHAIVHPPIDRHLPPDQVEDVYVHVERETDDGLVVSGAKVVATNSVLTHYNFVGLYPPPITDPRYAVIFMAPMSTPGVKLIARPSYELHAAVVGSPFDYPLSSRYDENDAILVFDKAVIPWDCVLCYGDVDRANAFTFEAGWLQAALLQGCTRFAVKLEFIAGVLLKAVEATGTKDFRGVQARVGEVILWRDMFWALSEAMARNPVPLGAGYVMPNPETAWVFRAMGQHCYPIVKGIVEQTVGSGLIYLNSHASDFQNPELSPYLEKYVRGSGGMQAVDRVKLLKLLWDAMGTEFGGRQELYERNWTGSDEGTRFDALQIARRTGRADEFMAFADKCLADYDLDGWRVPGYVDRSDVNIFTKR
jgi:4-hydroxyphenylacetate 3-monooxygenase